MKSGIFKRIMTLYLLVFIFLDIGHFGTKALSAVSVSNSLEFNSSNLPIVVIDTRGKTIYDQFRIEAQLWIINNGEGRRNYLIDPPNDYDGRIAIELRGCSSGSYPKQQYRFETQDSSGNNLNVSLLGLPKENDWIFYGPYGVPYGDRSLIRNVLAYKLSNDIGRYASRTRFCELVLNNDYRGLYVLMEKIKRDRNRVNISRMDSSDTSGNALTGGYIIKIDKLEGENIGYWESPKGTCYQYHYPKPDQIVAEQRDYILNFMNNFESVMYGHNYADPENGYPKYLDIDSFVDHFILNEFCKNVDAYRISAFMYKDRDSKGGKLNMGPIWDFNLSLGKAWFPEDNYLTEGWEVDHNHYRPNDWPKVPFWWEKLGHDPAFANRVKMRWFELRRGNLQKDSLFSSIDFLVDFLAEARTRNFKRWPEAGNADSYRREIPLLKQWISDRFDWIDENIDKLMSVQKTSHSENFAESFVLEQNYPNPFNAQTVIKYQLPRPSKVKLSIYNLFGQEVRTLVDEERRQGSHEVRWHSTNNSAKAVASGIYIYQIKTDNFVKARRLLLLK